MGKDKYLDDRYEKPVLLLIASIIVILVFVQIIILNNSSGLFNQADLEYQGAALGKTEYLYGYGFITIELKGAEPKSEVIVLKNGTEIADFSNRIVKLEVMHGDIIEIDASEAKDREVVKVISVSKGISDECRHASVSLYKEVKTLLKVK